MEEVNRGKSTTVFELITKVLQDWLMNKEDTELNPQPTAVRQEPSEQPDCSMAIMSEPIATVRAICPMPGCRLKSKSIAINLKNFLCD